MCENNDVLPNLENWVKVFFFSFGYNTQTIYTFIAGTFKEGLSDKQFCTTKGKSFWRPDFNGCPDFCSILFLTELAHKGFGCAEQDCSLPPYDIVWKDNK